MKASCTKCNIVRDITKFPVCTLDSGTPVCRYCCDTHNIPYGRLYETNIPEPIVKAVTRTRGQHQKTKWNKTYKKSNKYKERTQRWVDNNQAKIFVDRAKRRAKKKGFEFNLTEDDIHIPTHCPVLGILMFRGEGVSGPNSPTLDRIDSSKGYIKGNVQVISKRANTVKNDASIDEIEKILAYMKLEAEKK